SQHHQGLMGCALIGPGPSREYEHSRSRQSEHKTEPNRCNEDDPVQPRLVDDLLSLDQVLFDVAHGAPRWLKGSSLLPHVRPKMPGTGNLWLAEPSWKTSATMHPRSRSINRDGNGRDGNGERNNEKYRNA